MKRDAKEKQPPEALLDLIRPRVHPRARLRVAGRARPRARFSLHIISHGLAFNLPALLPADLARRSIRGPFTGGCWRVALPPNVTLGGGEDFRFMWLTPCARATPGTRWSPSVTDTSTFPLPATRTTSSRLRGSTLGQLCAEAGIPCHEFDRFDELPPRWMVQWGPSVAAGSAGEGRGRSAPGRSRALPSVAASKLGRGDATTWNRRSSET